MKSCTQWEELVRANASLLAGATPARIPALLAGEAGLVARVRSGEPEEGEEVEELDGDTRSGLARNVLASALILALLREGWSLHCMPGDPVVLEREGKRIDLSRSLFRLGRGAEEEMRPEEWAAMIRELGIAELDLSPPA